MKPKTALILAYLLFSIFSPFFFLGAMRNMLGLAVMGQLWVFLPVYDFIKRKKIKIEYIILMIMGMMLVYAGLFFQIPPSNQTVYLNNNNSFITSYFIFMFFILGGFMIIALVVSALSTPKELRNKAQTEIVIGKCIDYKIDDSQSRTTIVGVKLPTYVPIFQYIINGKEYSLASDFIKTHRIPKVGKEIKILVNKNNPNDAFIKPPKALLTALCFMLPAPIIAGLLVLALIHSLT